MSSAAHRGLPWLVMAVAACSGCAAGFAGSAGPRVDGNSLRVADAPNGAGESTSNAQPVPKNSGRAGLPEPPLPRAPNRTIRTLGWIGISVGAEAAIVAIGTSGVLLHEKKVRADDCNAQRFCSSDGIDANSTIGTLVGWNAAAWVLTAVGFGAGGALLAIGSEDAKPTVAITAAPIASGIGVGMRSAF